MKIIGDGIWFEYQLQDDKTYKELSSYNYDETFARRTFINKTTSLAEPYPLIPAEEFKDI